MPRKQRVWFPDAMYHVTNRGVRKMTIFFDEADYLKYLQIIEETKERYPFLLHAYCLMTNHVHLLLQTLNDPLPTIMRHINANYAIYFNKRHGLVGHVFQGRYGAEWINSLDYELDVSKYIHLNPVRALMVKKAEDYRWSSYRNYILYDKSPFVHTKKILSHFQDPAPHHYQRFTEREDESPQPPDFIKPYVQQT